MDEIPQSSPAKGGSGPEFAKLPISLLREKDLSFAAACLYARLRLYAGRDGVCNPSQETLSRELAISARSVRQLLTELRDWNLLTWRRTPGASSYRLSPPEQCLCPDRKKASDHTRRKRPIGSEGNFRSDRKETSDKKMSLSRSSSKDVPAKEEHDHDYPPLNREIRDSPAGLVLLAEYPNLRDHLREHLHETDPLLPSRDKVIRIIQATGHASEKEIIGALRDLRERGYGADHIRTYKYFETALADYFRQKREREEAALPVGCDQRRDRNETRLSSEEFDRLSSSF